MERNRFPFLKICISGLLIILISSCTIVGLLVGAGIDRNQKKLVGKELPGWQVDKIKEGAKIRVRYFIKDSTKYITSEGRFGGLLAEDYGSPQKNILKLHIDSRRYLRIPLNNIDHVVRLNRSNGVAIGTLVGVTIDVTLVIVVINGLKNFVSAFGHGIGGASCPLIYSKSSKGFQFEAEALSNRISPHLAATDIIPLSYPVHESDYYFLELRNEMPEIDYLDQAQLMIIDHDPQIQILPDPKGLLHQVGQLNTPIECRDFRGHEVSNHFNKNDSSFWSTPPFGFLAKDNNQKSKGWLDLEFEVPDSATTAKLILTLKNTEWASFLNDQFMQLLGDQAKAWLDSLQVDQQKSVNWWQSKLRENGLQVSVYDGSEWVLQGTIAEVGPYIARSFAIPLSLPQTGDQRIKVKLSFPHGCWDFNTIKMDFSEPLAMNLDKLEAMDTPYNGKPIQNLSEIDKKYTVLSPKDAVQPVYFNTPNLEPGKTRSLFLKLHGYYVPDFSHSGHPKLEKHRHLVETEDAFQIYNAKLLNQQLNIILN